MKKVKKLICFVMTFVLIAMSLAVSSFAEDDTTLQFAEDGKFKIMMFADSQDNEDLEETTRQLMVEALRTYNPDLVIFMGDNTVAKGYDNQYAAIQAVVEPCLEQNVPYAIVFGNHDQEQGVDKEDLLEIYRSFNCLTYDAVPEMSGCGTCNLPIYSSNGEKIAFNLWLTDSGSRNADKSVGGYDYVHEDQIEWYRSTAEALKEQNGGEVVPAMNFQHIIVPEIYYAMGFTALPVTVGGDFTYMGKTFIPIPKFSSHTGMLLEPPCPPNVVDGQFDAWAETGDVMASFFGHDHTNTFTAVYNGIDLTAVPTVGCNSYSSDLTRGVGLITLDENDPYNYSYELIHIYDLALADDSQIPNVDGGHSKFEYKFFKLIHNLLDTIHQFFYSFNFNPIK